MPEGIVTRSTGSRYRVRDPEGKYHECVARGHLREKEWKSTNPLAVGDRVVFEPARAQVGNETLGAITELHDRTNYVVRRSVNLSHHKQVIAANVDQALLVVTVARPRTSYGFIDRFLVTSEAYRVPVVILFNKADELNESELALQRTYQNTYEGAGYRTLALSALRGTGLKEVRTLMGGRTSLLGGHSGVGKSTLLNALDPGLVRATAQVSEASQKGQHTTTYAEMIELTKYMPPATYVIDTPGIKGFGLVDMAADEIVDQFPELFSLKGDCRFSDCKHLNEPGCAVKKSVAEGQVAESRYRSYVDMVNGVDDDGPYRTRQEG
jgi:ribosome biogenesis GTPase / thiamine phosphate phosphatase